MPACVWHLCSESWPECVHIWQSTAEVLNCQLTWHSKVGLLLEELFWVIDSSLNLRDILDQATFWQNCCHLEHLSGSFTISCSDQRSVDIQETIVLEKLVGCISQIVLDSENWTQSLGSRSQMSNISQSFKVNFLTCERIFIIITSSINLNSLEVFSCEFHLDKLSLTNRFLDFSCQLEWVPNFGFFDILPIGNRALNDNLKRISVASINKFNEK